MGFLQPFGGITYHDWVSRLLPFETYHKEAVFIYCVINRIAKSKTNLNRPLDIKDKAYIASKTNHPNITRRLEIDPHVRPMAVKFRVPCCTHDVRDIVKRASSNPTR